MHFTAIKNKLFLYIQKNKKNILFGAASVALLVVCVVAFVFVLEKIEERRFAQVESKTTEALLKQQEFLLEQAGQLSEMEELRRSIKEEDVLNILSTLENVKRKHGIPLILVTDERGITLTRLSVISKRGDFIFQTSSWGRAVGNGESIASIEDGIAHPMVMIAGTQIFEDENMIGSVFPAYSFNDEYAADFSRNFFKNGTEIAFYSREHGITGTSMRDPEKVELLSAAFGKDTSWVTSGRTDEKITLNGTDYFVKNTQFEGIEGGQIGGALIFIPQRHVYYSIIASALVAFIFLVLALVIFFDDLTFNVKTKGVVCVCNHKSVSTFIVMFLALFVALFFLNKGIFARQSTEISKPSHAIYNATMHFEPESDIFDITFLQRVDVNIKIGGETINAAQAVISFDPSLVEVEEIITRDSFCRQDMFIEKSIDNENGEVVIICGTVPGYNAPEANLATLIINPLQEGQLTLSFEEGTQVLAHDGLGTDVLRTAEASSYNIVGGSSDAGETFAVFSSSHPNGARWYNKPKARFSWVPSAGHEYWYEFDTNPDTIPSGANTTTDNSIELEIEDDGIYYFHVTSVNENGEKVDTFSYRILADQTPPSTASIRASEVNIGVNEVVRFEFSGKDDLSGLQEGFYIKFDNGIFLPVGRSFSTAFLEPGTRNITLRTFDRAGNHKDEDIEINVSRESLRSRFFRWWRWGD